LTEDDDGLVDVYTVEDVIDKIGFGVFQVFLSLMAGGMWVSNYHIAGNIDVQFNLTF